MRGPGAILYFQQPSLQTCHTELIFCYLALEHMVQARLKLQPLGPRGRKRMLGTFAVDQTPHQELSGHHSVWSCQPTCRCRL